MKFRTIIHQIHLWLGLLSGAIVVVLAITGCILAFEQEIKLFIHSDRYYVAEVKEQKLPMSELKAIAEGAFPWETKARRVEISGDPQRNYVFRSMKINADAWTYWGYYEYYVRVYVDPYSGEVVYVEDAKKDFFELVLNLHRRLWLGEKIGKPITGYATLILLVVLVSGLFIWVPRKLNKKSVKWMFLVKKTRNIKRLNFDFHKVAGFYTLIPLILICYSAMIWGFKGLDKSVLCLLNGNREEVKTAVVTPNVIFSIDRVTDHIWNHIDSILDIQNKVYFSFPRTATGYFNVEIVHADKHYQSDKFNFNPYSGAQMDATLAGAARLGWGTRLRNMNYDLHTGSILGFSGRIIYLFVGLIAAMLPITGFIIWWRKKK
ncbi:PepSY-associated TM helix domain-containing protein [Sphingobacterium tabacisoli]|uniref:PepSY-associated TM helix domain-containing protein n=1 Tax=Sphingobacterium tabacisoli TaxID=2044855 RepID=A0ABW5KXE4_9SPHI|nr:PepSY-associated TM helix domain-containing protein [Sphingobacterium tabacisoli]